MMRTSLLITAAALVLGLQAMGAQSPAAAEKLFASAQHKETTEGDLRGSIALYERVVNEAAANRSLAARALLRMAEAHQKLGNDEARRIYERIVQQYGDQTEIATMARGRLGAGPSMARGIRFEKVWNGWADSISHNGRLVFPGGPFPNRMMVHDLKTGLTRPIADDASESGRNALGGVVSRDGSRAAYVSCGGDERCEFRVVAITGGTERPRVLFDSERAFAFPMDWSPNGATIAVMIQRPDRTNQLALVNAVDGAIRVLKSLDWRGSTAVRFSPDGGHLLFDTAASDTGTQRDVFVIAVDGSREVPLAVHPAYDTAIGWSPDGRHALFASDRTGTRGLWHQRVGDGSVVGAPEVAVRDVGNALPLGLTPDGALYVLRDAGRGNNIEVVSIDLETGKITAPARRPISRYVGTNSQPAWSADGKSLVYMALRGTANERALMVHSLETGTDREVPLAPVLSWFIGPTWSPDGRYLAVVGADLKARHGVFRVEVATGAVTPVLHTTFAPPENGGERLTYEGVSWSPDSRRLYFHKAGGAIVEWNFETNAERKVAAGNYGPIALSPDGRLIATYRPFNVPLDERTARSSVVIVPVDGEPAREIWRLEPGEWINNAAMSWTPDGRSILVRRMLKQGATDSELWIVPVSGGAPRKLDIDANRIAAYQPGKIRLHPDGKQLAYQTLGEGTEAVWVIENFLPAN